MAVDALPAAAALEVAGARRQAGAGHGAPVQRGALVVDQAEHFLVAHVVHVGAAPEDQAAALGDAEVVEVHIVAHQPGREREQERGTHHQAPHDDLREGEPVGATGDQQGRHQQRHGHDADVGERGLAQRQQAHQHARAEEPAQRLLLHRPQQAVSAPDHQRGGGQLGVQGVDVGAAVEEDLEAQAGGHGARQVAAAQPPRQRPDAQQPGEHPQQVAQLDGAGEVAGAEVGHGPVHGLRHGQLQVQRHQQRVQRLAEVGGPGVGAAVVVQREGAVLEQVHRHQHVLDAVADDRVAGDAVRGLPGQAQADHQREQPAAGHGLPQGLVPPRALAAHPAQGQFRGQPHQAGDQGRTQRHRPDLARGRADHLPGQPVHEVGVGAGDLEADHLGLHRQHGKVAHALDGLAQGRTLQGEQAPAASEFQRAEVHPAGHGGRVHADLGHLAQRVHIDRVPLPFARPGRAGVVQPLAEVAQVVGQVQLVGAGALDPQVKNNLQIAAEPGLQEDQEDGKKGDGQRPEGHFARGLTCWLAGERLMHARPPVLFVVSPGGACRPGPGSALAPFGAWGLPRRYKT